MACALGHPYVLGNEHLWQYLLLWPAVPALLGILLALYVPESPKFLYLAKGDREGAKKSLDYFFQEEGDHHIMFEEYDREKKYLMVSSSKNLYYCRVSVTTSRLEHNCMGQYSRLCSILQGKGLI